jgi:hypothetical protein
MKRVRTLLVRAIVAALLLLNLGASVATADTGRLDGPVGHFGGRLLQILMLPEDPGIQ